MIIVFGLVMMLLAYQSTDAGKTRKSKSKTYQFKDKTLIQTIVIDWQNDNRIKFEYTVKNTKRRKTIKVKGVADNPYPDTEAKTEEEELDGLVYPSTQYMFADSGCHLTIQIELNKKDRVVINSGECPKYANAYCPLNSQGVLKIMKSPPHVAKKLKAKPKSRK